MKRDNNKLWILCFIVITAMLIAGCQKERFSDIKTSEIQLQIYRFDQDLFNGDKYDINKSVVKLKSTYPEFLSLFGNKIIQIGDPSQEWFNKGLLSFTTDQAIHNVYKRVKEVYPDIKAYVLELEQSFGKWKTIFPERSIPDIYTYVSGFNQSIVTAEGILGISLEKYLGNQEPLYNQVYPPIPAYQRRLMMPKKIVPDVMKAWSTTEISYSPEKDNLISQMIYKGQIMYLTSKLLPNMNDTLLWGFTNDQMNFCRDNEQQMWTYLIEQKLLFSTENFQINQFVNEGPFTKDFTNKSPSQAAVWIGYRIIDYYANSDKNLSLHEIVTNNNYQEILNKAKYNP